MKKYLVGGFVRDTLLGKEPKDRDWVVVGATPEEMLDLGYKQVGADFPVFLNPESGDEYALARTERKSGRGYQGFSVDFSKEVTLEEDLIRRDLTINAIAMDDDMNIHDPHNGQEDLKNGVLRHVSEAFKEDPVRVLRVARFAARYRFAVADETLELMREMVKSGEVDFLVPERVWTEFEKGLMEDNGHLMIKVLKSVGALERIATILDATTNDDVLRALVFAQIAEQPLHVRYSIITHGAWNIEGLKVPADFKKLNRALWSITDILVRRGINAHSLTDVFRSVDVLRQPQRFKDAFMVIQFLALSGATDAFIFNNVTLIRAAQKAFMEVDGGAIAEACTKPEEIRDAVLEARFNAVKNVLDSWED